jgi:hypothetical protein
MVLSLEQNTFIVMSYYRNGNLQNGEWVYSIDACKEEFFAKFSNDNIMEGLWIDLWHLLKKVKV